MLALVCSLGNRAHCNFLKSVQTSITYSTYFLSLTLPLAVIVTGNCRQRQLKEWMVSYCIHWTFTQLCACKAHACNSLLRLSPSVVCAGLYYVYLCVNVISVFCMQAGYTPVMLIAAHGVDISKNMEVMNHLIARSDVNICTEQVGFCIMVYYIVSILLYSGKIWWVFYSAVGQSTCTNWIINNIIFMYPANQPTGSLYLYVCGWALCLYIIVDMCRIELTLSWLCISTCFWTSLPLCMDLGYPITPVDNLVGLR